MLNSTCASSDATHKTRETEMLVLLTRILLWASMGLLLWYILVRIIPPKYLTWFGGFILIALLALSFIEADNDTVRIIWQILSFPLRPLGLSLLLLGGAISEGAKRVKGTPVVIAFTILFFCSIPIFAQQLVSDAEQRVRTVYEQRAELCGDVCRNGEIPNQGDLGQAAGIVVLGDSADIDQAINVSDTPGNVSINTALAPRLIYAAGLYREAVARGANPTVFVTAGDGDDEEQDQVVRDILSANRVPVEVIQTEDTDLDVYTTGTRIERFLQERQIIGARDTRGTDGPRVVLVAPAIVMSRAALTFERLGLQVIAKPTDFYTPRFGGGGDLLDRLPDILPSADALQLTTNYWNELLASLYYFLRGWLPDFNFGWNSNIEI
ncbi:MAG: ElyC/SanA/YdcF family protein [Phormidesmis sp.]